MRSLVRWGGVLVVVVALSASLVGGGAQQPADEPAKGEAEAKAYNNPLIFAEMSGAKRSALERKFGVRPGRGVAITGEEFTSDALRPFTAALSPLANVLVNHPGADTTAQDTQSETAVLFGNGLHIVAAFNDSGSHVAGASRFTGWSLSVDGGATFGDKGTLPANPDGDSGDPVLARSLKTNTIFLSTLSFNTGHKLLIFRSTNNGVSFNTPVNGAPGFTPATGEQDKQWIAVDNRTGAGFGNVYMFWRNFASGGGMTFSRSTDDGVTWGPSGGLKLADGGQGAHLTVGRDHSVYAFWYDSSVTPRQIRVRKSTDHGVTFGAAVTAAKLKATGINGDLGLSPGFRTNSFPQVVASPLNAKHLFMVYNDQTGSGGTLDRGDIYLVRSTNGGASWTAPVKINTDATRRDQWSPSIAITPNGKRLCVTWYDRRLDPSNNLIDRHGVIGKVTALGTVTFGSNFRITNQSFPPVFGVDPVVNGTYMGDYDQMTASNTHFGVTWGDNRDDSTGHAGKNANVRFAKIPVAGPTDPTTGPTYSDEPMVQIPVEDVPAFAMAAIKVAVDDAPESVLAKPVTWEEAFEMQETIAMFQLKGKDAKGRPVEAESKGTRVIELEVQVAPADLPAEVASGSKAMSASFAPSQATAIVVGGRVVGYTLVGPDGAKAGVAEAGAGNVEANFTAGGKLISRRALTD